MTARAWECAWALWTEHADRLSAQQAVAVLVALRRADYWTSTMIMETTRV